MRIRQIIRSGGFEPQDVKLLDAVFDASWHQLQGYYPPEGTEREVARERLAAIVVDIRQDVPLSRCGRIADQSRRDLRQTRVTFCLAGTHVVNCKGELNKRVLSEAVS